MSWRAVVFIVCDGNHHPRSPKVTQGPTSHRCIRLFFFFPVGAVTKYLRSLLKNKVLLLYFSSLSTVASGPEHCEAGHWEGSH